jgi:hypothetical protein
VLFVAVAIAEKLVTPIAFDKVAGFALARVPKAHPTAICALGLTLGSVFGARGEGRFAVEAIVFDLQQRVDAAHTVEVPLSSRWVALMIEA